jgi:outer membrane protein TolC
MLRKRTAEALFLLSALWLFGPVTPGPALSAPEEVYRVPEPPAGSAPQGKPTGVEQATLRARPPQGQTTPSGTRAEIQIALPQPPAAPPGTPAAGPEAAPFAGAAVLSVEDLVREVLARNPSLAQMAAAWQAASARYPQVTSLGDPMFTVTLGPASYTSNTVNPAYRLALSQKYPWPGKLALRGQSALAEARAAGNEVEDMRLQLVESAQGAFYDYYLVGRALQVNAANLQLLEKFLRSARSRYENKLVPLQDVLQTQVEIGRERQRRLTLERTREVAVARLNTLLNLLPDAPLPPPPRDLQVRDGLPEAQVLRAAALARRPDLQALANRITAEEAALALARKEFYPDLEAFAMYDRFMGNNPQSQDLATMVGVKLNLPVRKARRHAAVAEAQARINQRRAELARQTNQVNFEVQQAYAQVRESEQSVRIYEQTILPKARENVESAVESYETGNIPALSLIEAQRSRVGLQDKYYEAVADYFRRRATLERVVGGPLLGESQACPP